MKIAGGAPAVFHLLDMKIAEGGPCCFPPPGHENSGGRALAIFISGTSPGDVSWRRLPEPSPGDVYIATKMTGGSPGLYVG